MFQRRREGRRGSLAGQRRAGTFAVGARAPIWRRRAKRK